MTTEQNKLTKKDKEAVGLLSIGTFLEYFDLMLYVHMSVLLNDLFFPQDNPLTAEIFALFTFCSTFVLRPVGGFIVGYIGDYIGRKNTIMITTLLMALCCITIASIKTYAEIGIIASYTIILCRVLQGFTSMGEIIGAQLYLVETLKQPYKYICGGIVNIQSKLGGLFALVIAYISTSVAFNWRIAFVIGTIIALVGLVARTRLRESPEFADHKRRINLKKYSSNQTELTSTPKNNKKVILSYFFLHLPFAVCFYTAYIYSASFMKKSMGMSPNEIIIQNLKTNFLFILVLSFLLFFLKKHHPLKLAKFNLLCSIIILAFIPYWFNNVSGLLSLTLLQLAILSFEFTASITELTCFKHIPLTRRFTIIAVTFGVSGAVGYGLAPFVLTFFSKSMEHYSIWLVYLPIIIPYYVSLNYIKKLEIKNGNYYSYPYKDNEVEEDLYNYNYELRKEYEPFKKECKYSSKLLEMIESINKTAKVPVNIKLVKKAIAFAKKWHDGQMRKTGEPYYTHPLAVAMMTAPYKYKTYMIVSAILHDVVEDSDCTVELIAKEFNPRIAEIVKLLTREEENRKLTIAESMKKIFDAKDYDALLIKGLDRLHNLQTIRGMKPEKRRKIAEETIYEIANIVAYAVDDLNINNKNKLEKKLYKLSNKALKSAMNNS